MSDQQDAVPRKAPDVAPAGEYRPPAPRNAPGPRFAPPTPTAERSSGWGDDDNRNWRTGARVEQAAPAGFGGYNGGGGGYSSGRGGYRGSSDGYRGGRGGGGSRMGGGRGGMYGGAVSGYGSNNAAGGFTRGSRRDWGEDRPSAPNKDDGTWATRDGRYPNIERETEVFKSAKDKTTGINFDSYDAIEVEVSGNNTGSLQPLLSFRTAADMPAELTANILRVRYDKPTPVQKYAIPILLADRDLMACAQTGSGKTAAFLFPIIIKMLKQGPPPAIQSERRVPHPVALVLSPTRELTCQIFEESRKFAFGTGIRTVVVYGGTDTRAQLIDLSKGCDICVATPGRLNDILERAKISLSHVKYLVLDEADRMLDMGFAPQIHQIVETKDMPNSQQGRQTAMFSATFPREIQQLAADFLLNYVYLTVGRVGSTNEFITQKLIYAEEVEKPKRLLQLLKESKGRVLVFVETKKKADVIEDYLIKQGLHATSIHGDRSQGERSRALELFKDGRCPVLVATDVAARGLDIHSITWVINLDLPHNIEDYVHRIGRTGRAGNFGMATSFVNEQNRPILRELHRLLEEANQEVPSWFLDLTRACSNAASRFGPSRYGGRGGRGGNFGGVDFRSLDNGNRSRFNVGTGSPRGGMGGYGNRQNDSGYNGGNAGGGYGNRAPASTRAPVQHDGDDCW